MTGDIAKTVIVWLSICHLSPCHFRFLVWSKIISDYDRTTEVKCHGDRYLTSSWRLLEDNLSQWQATGRVTWPNGDQRSLATQVNRSKVQEVPIYDKYEKIIIHEWKEIYHNLAISLGFILNYKKGPLPFLCFIKTIFNIFCTVLGFDIDSWNYEFYRHLGTARSTFAADLCW